MKQGKSLLFAITLVLFSWAAGTPSRPDHSLVYDENRLLSAQQVEYFDRISEELSSKTGSVIAIALLDDIGKRNIHDYAFEIAQKWGIDCKSGKGIMILIALKQRRQVVEIGSGNTIPQSQVETLQQGKLFPAFRKERYGEGINTFAFALADALTRESATTLNIAPPPNEDSSISLRGWIFIIVVFGALIAFGGRARRFGFFDNMKKLLSTSEIEKSEWPDIFRKTFGDNLISAFLHGKCLMEGFDALDSPWTVSFILKDNSPEVTEKLQPFLKRASRENISFRKFYSPAEIVRTLDATPLEYLHIANRNIPLCGIRPFSGFQPHDAPLRKECTDKLKAICDTQSQSHSGKNPDRTFAKLKDAALPVLYGVYYLETGAYPENDAQVFDRYTELNSNDPIKAIDAIIRSIQKNDN